MKTALTVLIAMIASSSFAQEEGLFDVRVASIPETRTVRVLLSEQGAPLFPLYEIAAFLELDIPRENALLELHRDWIVKDDETFVTAEMLGRVLGARTVVDWENLQLVISGAELPVDIRRRNEQRRRTALRGLPHAGEPDVPYPPRSGGAAAGWGISGTYDGFRTRGSARAVVATAVLGGALEAGYEGTLGGEAHRGDPWGRYTRAFPQSSWLRELQIGEVRGGGIVSRAFRGVSITNEPLYTPVHFGDALIRPVVPAGWDYEIYQGDYLLGYSAPGGGDPVATPIGYGTTPVRVRMLGPLGQERTEEITFLVPAVQVPAGQWRYATGAGECVADDCRAFGFLDVRTGVTSNITAGLGLDHLTHDDRRGQSRPHGMLSMLVRPDLRVELRGRAESLAHAIVQQYRSSGGWRVSGGWQRDEGSAATQAGAWFADGTGAWHLPGGSTTIVSGRFRGDRPGSPDQWQAGVITGVPRLQAGVSYESGLQAADVFSLSTRMFVPRRASPRIGEWSLDARLDFAGRAVQGGGLTATMLPTERVSFSAGLVWRAGSRRPEASVAMLVRARGAYVQNRAFANHARTGALVSAGGGVAFDRGGFFIDPFESIDRAGARGVVFIDEDGDGVRGPTEVVLPDIAVVVGGERTVTDADGRYRVWGLSPYMVVSAAVDLSAVARTDLTPARSESLVRLTPNASAVIDLPLLYTREVTGHVRWSGGAPARGGITVEARRRDGQTFRVLTFSDGTYYFEGLPAGEYTLTIAESSLQVLGAVMDGAAPIVIIRGTASQSVVTAPALQLRPGRDR